MARGIRFGFPRLDDSHNYVSELASNTDVLTHSFATTESDKPGAPPTCFVSSMTDNAQQ